LYSIKPLTAMTFVQRGRELGPGLHAYHLAGKPIRGECGLNKGRVVSIVFEVENAKG
jgi:hypothetical protein